MEQPGATIEAEEGAQPDPVEDEPAARRWFKVGALLAAAAVLQVIADEAGIGVDGELLLMGVLLVLGAVSGLWWFMRREERPLDQLAEMQREAERGSSAASPPRSE